MPMGVQLDIHPVRHQLAQFLWSHQSHGPIASDCIVADRQAFAEFLAQRAALRFVTLRFAKLRDSLDALLAGLRVFQINLLSGTGKQAGGLQPTAFCFPKHELHCETEDRVGLFNVVSGQINGGWEAVLGQDGHGALVHTVESVIECDDGRKIRKGALCQPLDRLPQGEDGDSFPPEVIHPSSECLRLHEHHRIKSMFAIQRKGVVAEDAKPATGQCARKMENPCALADLVDEAFGSQSNCPKDQRLQRLISKPATRCQIGENSAVSVSLI